MLKQKISCRAKITRLNLTYEKIKLVRKERGKQALGDVLLQSAQIALKFKDVRSVLLDLASFLRIVQDLDVEHKAVLAVESVQISSSRSIKLGPLIRGIVALILEIIYLLSSKHPLSCQQSGRFFRLYYIDVKNA